MLALAAFAPALAGCQTAGDVTGALHSSDARDRHPIKLADAPRTLDLFVQGSGLDGRSRRDVEDFVAEHRRFGNGPLAIQVPTGVANAAAIRRAVAEIRARTGRGAGVSSYWPADPDVASPVRLSFNRLRAQVASTCGLWPQDLGVSDAAGNAQNLPYWNHGCAVQSNFAAQIADPVDLVRPRGGTPPDTLKRTFALEQIRQGKDPSTAYRQDNAFKINTSVGN